MHPAEPSPRREPVEEVAEEFLQRFRQGERPSLTEFVEKHPELADEIRELFPALVILEQLGEQPGSWTPGASPCSASAPERIGDYRIVREVGRGGMGVVYEAVQESLGRHVALKVLPFHALLDPQQLSRFQREARAAARLHHTNIVPVFGVGQENGLHYYAMQFIAGHGLDDVLREIKRQRGARTHTAAMVGTVAPGEDNRQPAPLPVPDRSADSNSSSSVSRLAAEAVSTVAGSGSRYARQVARVGVQVAEALAHAHSHGIVHRDIKPSNLLIDQVGTVWVTDFGLATSEGADDLTHTGDIVGTLRYLAPERLNGWSDPRSDVYSLGLTLYELLTFRAAFDETHRAQLLAQIARDDPPPPRRLNHDVSVDLETVILKAINKEPSERYQSAVALAEDLLRYLADRPIEARRSSVREHLWRWCRRNPALAGAIATALLFLLVGSTAVFTQWRRAETNLRWANRNAEDAQAQSTEAARRKDEAERNAAAAERRRVEADANLQNAIDAADRLLSRVGARRLAPVPQAEQVRRELLEDALVFFQRLSEKRSDDPAIQRHVGLAHTRVGDIHRELGRFQEAEQPYRDALAVLEPLAARSSGGALDLERLGDALNNLAVVLDNTGRSAEAEPIHRRVYELRQKLVKSFPTTASYRNDLGQTCNNLAVLLHDANRRDEAKPFYQQARELILQLAEEFPKVAEYQEALARDYFNHGVRQKDEDSAVAEESLRLALAIYQQLHERTPTNAHYREMLGRAHSSLGDALRILKRPADSEAQHREAARVMEQLAADFPTNADFQHLLGGVLHNLAMVLNNTGQLTPAREFTERAVRHQKQALKIAPSSRDYRRYLANHLVQLQRILFQLKLHDQVSQAALELSNVPGLPVDRYYQAACFSAGCIHLVQNDSAIEGEAQEQRIQAYGDQAMKILRQTIAKGFKDFTRLRKDTDLGPLRDRDDFQALLAELSGN